MRIFAILLAGLVLTGLARADDADPEPPAGAATLRKLKGEWTSVRWFAGAGDFRYPGEFVYEFDGRRATFTHGKKTIEMKVEPDNKRPNSFLMFRPSTATPTRYFYRIVKGELYLIVDTSNDPKVKLDFTGKTMPVIVYKREK